MFIFFHCVVSVILRVGAIKLTALNAWSLNGDQYPDAATKAEELLNLQKKLTMSGELGDMAKPDSVSYVLVMKAYKLSNDPDKVHHGHRLLKDFISGVADGSVKPGKTPNVPFTLMLGLLALTPPSTKEPVDAFTSERDDDVYTIALQTYRELKDDVHGIGCKPDHFDFAAMLRATTMHTDINSTERRQMTSVIFEDACAAGWVSFYVINALREACPDKQLLGQLLQSNILAESIDSVDMLPRSWSRNVFGAARFIKSTSTADGGEPKDVQEEAPTTQEEASEL